MKGWRNTAPTLRPETPLKRVALAEGPPDLVVLHLNIIER